MASTHPGPTFGHGTDPTAPSTPWATGVVVVDDDNDEQPTTITAASAMRTLERRNRLQ
jgi:hypothetical protein